MSAQTSFTLPALVGAKLVCADIRTSPYGHYMYVGGHGASARWRGIGDARAGAQMRRYLEGAAEAKVALQAADEACYAQARILIDSP